MLQVHPAVETRFSLAQARSLIRDLFEPNPRIYWTDFLVTIFSGYVCYGLVRGVAFLWPEPTAVRYGAQGFFFVASCLLYYRAAIFIHELVHLPRNKFQSFRLVWNILLGVPFLMPSFVYLTHIDHHRRKSFGTKEDGEYLPLGLRGLWYMAGYLSLSLIIPIATVFRFLVLTPLTWISPAIRRWVFRHASSMVMDPTYVRPQPLSRDLFEIRLQELGCFLVCFGVATIGPVFMNKWPIPLVTQAYCTAVFIIFLNSVRTMASHRWWNDGRELNFVDQMLDSVTVAERPWFSELWGPVGTRYHGLHHLFPSLPYHAMPEAHRRLMAHLPADSPYRQTVEPSITSALVNLFKRSWASGNAG